MRDVMPIATTLQQPGSKEYVIAMSLPSYDPIGFRMGSFMFFGERALSAHWGPLSFDSRHGTLYVSLDPY